MCIPTALMCIHDTLMCIHNILMCIHTSLMVPVGGCGCGGLIGRVVWTVGWFLPVVPYPVAVRIVLTARVVREKGPLTLASGAQIWATNWFLHKKKSSEALFLPHLAYFGYLIIISLIT